jgi:tetratricopeptide (TPR) repeat protein
MKNWILLLLLLAAACAQKRQSPTDAVATRLCNCFSSKTVGSVDDRLTPCFQRVISEKQKELQSAGNQEFFQGQLEAFGLDLMVALTRDCDSYFKEVNSLYDNSYPLDSSVYNRREIIRLTEKIESESNEDSVKSMLHKRVYKLMQSRQYTEALQDIQRIEFIDSSDYRAHLAKAFLFNQTGMYDDAIAEIQKAVDLSGNPNMILYAEIVKGKGRRERSR